MNVLRGLEFVIGTVGCIVGLLPLMFVAQVIINWVHALSSRGQIMLIFSSMFITAFFVGAYT